MKLNSKKFKPDAFDPKTNTIYEFYGDYWHGNPIKFSTNQMNDRSHKTFGELYSRTINKENEIRKAGYHLITIWEMDWNKIKDNIGDIKKSG